MRRLFIPKIIGNNITSFEKAEQLLEKQAEANTIDTLNWKDFQYKPSVQFRTGHTENEIWIKFYIHEKHIRALETQINSDVYKDSCVEFFISFDGKNYYNFEFNGIGTIHVAHGTERKNRKLLSPQTVNTIKTKSTLGNRPFTEKTGNFDWEIMIWIPVNCFVYDEIESLKGKKASANFYKCGDATSKPHYLTWNPVYTKNPDFHQPSYFGEIEFGT